MPEIPQNLLLRDLAVVMIVAAVVTLVFHRLRQPVVLGYILAGVIIGPHTPPFPLIADKHSIETMAELGVVFLMFSLGMEFSLRKLRQVGTTAFIAATLEILLMVWVGYKVGQWFGWSKMDSIFLGAILSISSTTIIVKALQELGRTKEKFAEIIFGVLIVEDILAIAMIALLSSIALTGSLHAVEVMGTVGRVAIFLVVALIVGLIAVPRLLRYVSRFKSEEMMLVTVLGLCFGLSLLAVRLGYSVALGAFVMGTVIGEAREIGLVKRLTEPVRDMFSAVFFVAIGMLIEPRLLGVYAWPIVFVTVAVVVGKVVACSFGTFVAGHSTRTSLRVGMGLAQIGEFSFIIASLGLTLKVTSEFLYPIAVTVSAITTLLTPYLIKSSDRLLVAFDRVAPSWLVNYLELYSRWLESVRSGQRHSEARKLARKWAWQIALNVALATAAFLAAAYVAPRASEWWPNLPAWLGGVRGLLWLAAAIVALPGLIAAYRKLEALGMLLADIGIRRDRENGKTAVLRTLLVRTITISGALMIGLWVLVISAALLPEGPALLVLLAIVLVMAFLLWRFFIQVHSRAQFALREALAETPPEEPHETDKALEPLLRHPQVEAVAIPPGGAAAGKLIRELELRSVTGASIVGIQRESGTVINPTPDEELRAGDRVLLLGDREQLVAARALLTKANGGAQ